MVSMASSAVRRCLRAFDVELDRGRVLAQWSMYVPDGASIASWQEICCDGCVETDAAETCDGIAGAVVTLEGTGDRHPVPTVPRNEYSGSRSHS